MPPQLAPNAEALVLYGALILTPVLVFFLNMLSTRQTRVRAKARKSDLVCDQLATASLALEKRAERGQAEEAEALLGSIAAWVAYEDRIKRVPEWPYSAEIRRNLVLSTLLPLSIWTAREVLAELLQRSVPSP